MLGGGIFPDGIVSEILIRLPVKAITRFKCVSKRWKAIACNPNFIISYILRSSPTWVILDRYIRVDPESKPDFKLQWEQPPNVSTLSINPTNLGDGSKEFLLEDEFPAPLISSSNGLILFSIMIKRDPFKEKTATSFSWISEEDSLYVVNPITREWVPIPKPPECVQRRASVAFITEVGPIGVLERFMIVEYQPIIGSDAAILMCFSSETWKWENISANYMLGMHMWCGNCAFEFDGHLMWVDSRVGIITWDDPFAWGKEKEKKNVHCRFIKLPRPSLDSEEEDRRCVGVGGGHIQFMEVRKGGEYELCLWRLLDYQGGEWSLVHKLRFKDVWSDDSYLGYGLKKVLPQPCFMHPYEADVVVLKVGDRAFCLNLGTRKVACCGTGYCSLFRYTYLAPFMLPSWPLSFSPRSKATILKEEGNVFFKAKNFSEAINCYSKSITLSPNALAYANRAVAYLHVASYHEAEVDCTEALKLDGEYFKAYGRRAIARKDLGDLKGCVEDVEFALKLEPDNQGMKKLYAEAKSLIEKVQASSSGLDPMPTALPVQNDAFVKQEGDLGHARG